MPNKTTSEKPSAENQRIVRPEDAQLLQEQKEKLENELHLREEQLLNLLSYIQTTSKKETNQ